VQHRAEVSIFIFGIKSKWHVLILQKEAVLRKYRYLKFFMISNPSLYRKLR